jgi:tight adherence protein C
MISVLMVLGAAALCALVLSGAAMLMLRQNQRDEVMAGRVELARGRAITRAVRRPSGMSPLRLVAGLGLAIVRSGLLSQKTLAELELTLVTSGFRAENAIGLFVGSKILLLVGLTGAAFLFLHGNPDVLMRNAGMGAAAVAGLLIPDKIVRNIRASYRTKIERGLPDALDMMVICAQAGLGLEPAIARVAAEIGYAHPEIAREFAQTASEMQVQADSRVSLQRLGERTGVEGLRRLTTTLVQSVQYGTPLSDAMRGLAVEMRQELLTAFEERAARLSVFLTLPMIAFILPSVMIVVGGPAVIGLFKSLSH